MKVNPAIFRAYDTRGIYPSELNEKVAYQIASAFSGLYPYAKKIVVACDTRKSSPILAGAIIRALLDKGKMVTDLGIAPDPLFYFSIFHYRLDGGIMVSGSHNPTQYNGLTLHIRKKGRKVSEDVVGDDLEKIKELVIASKGSVPSKAVTMGEKRDLEPSRDYIDFVTSKIKLKHPLKIVVDAGNGSCGFLPEKVFREMGCLVKTIYGQFDGNFPHHLPDPYQEENLRDIKKMVLREKADLGFAYDADGDRVGIIDDRGRSVSGDNCLLILARQALRKKKGPIVHDMRVSKAFLDEMEKRGVKTYFSISHHNAVIKKIIEKKAVFGGEITLHFLFPLDYYLCDEAIFASLKIAEIASEHRSLARHIDSLPVYFTSPEVFIACPDDEKFKIIEELRKYLKRNKFDFIDIDGARINFPRGWALARAANTTPHIKCRFEGETKKDLIEVEKMSLDIFRKVGIPLNKKVYQELGLK